MRKSIPEYKSKRYYHFMLTLKHFEEGHYKSEPWKNGKGETTVIAQDEKNPFRWRLSRALLKEDGPFSSYPEYERSITVIKGGPVTLSHKEKKGRLLHEFTTYTFDGAFETSAVLKSLAVDFNVFALKEKSKASLYSAFLKRKAEMQFPLNGTEHFIYCVEGVIDILDPNTSQRLSLLASETLQVSRPDDKEYLNLRAVATTDRATCLWIPVHYA